MDREISRRTFLTELMKAAAGAGLYSFIPMTLPPLKLQGLTGDIRPYWLEVLSKGVHFYPENIISFFSDWEEDHFIEASQYAFFTTLNQNKRMLEREGLPSDKEMDRLIESNKTSQYIFEALKRIHLSHDTDPDTVYGNDPFHSRLLYDLSTIILRDIMHTTDASPNSDLRPFDVALLNSGITYLNDAISMSEHAYVICNDELRDILVKNIGSYYNNLGLTLSYLGDIPQARRVFERALEFRPGDELILQNMRDMESDSITLRKKSYSHSFLD